MSENPIENENRPASEDMPENEDPKAGSNPVKAARIASEVPPLPKRTLLQRLFDPETRLGRGMRAFTRGLGLVVGLYALGLLTTYILLFQPIERRFSAAQAELAQTNAALEALQSDLKLSQSNLAEAEQARKSSSAALANAQARLDVQRAAVKVMETRLALAQKDNAAARLALGEAEKILTALKPALSAAGRESLDQVLVLTKGDISRDARLAEQDLQRLLSELELINQGLK